MTTMLRDQFIEVIDTMFDNIHEFYEALSFPETATRQKRFDAHNLRLNGKN